MIPWAHNSELQQGCLPVAQPDARLYSDDRVQLCTLRGGMPDFSEMFSFT